MPEISVILTVYNQGEYLPLAVGCMLGQDFRNFELILVDDGSTDDSGELCDTFARGDGRVRVIHQENAGLSAARNAALDAVRGAWIAFIDADDAVGPSYLRLLHDAATSQQVQIAIAQVERFTDEPPASLGATTAKVRTMSGPEVCAGLFNTSGFIFDTAWGKIYSRELFGTLRYPVGRTREDMFVSHELLWPQERIAICEGCVYAYRMNPAGIMLSPISRASFDTLDALVERVAFYERVGAAELVEESREFIAWWNAKLVAEALLAGRGEEIPETWTMSVGEAAKRLSNCVEKPGVKRLLTGLLNLMRAGKR